MDDDRGHELRPVENAGTEAAGSTQMPIAMSGLDASLAGGRSMKRRKSAKASSLPPSVFQAGAIDDEGWARAVARHDGFECGERVVQPVAVVGSWP
jgi:hypothetical protein